MANQVPPVVCIACEGTIYFCKAVGRDFMGAPLRAEDFVPMGDYPQPKDGDEGLCPICGKPFALPNGKGGVILRLEGGAWWPHPPI